MISRIYKRPWIFVHSFSAIWYWCGACVMDCTVGFECAFRKHLAVSWSVVYVFVFICLLHFCINAYTYICVCAYVMCVCMNTPVCVRACMYLTIQWRLLEQFAYCMCAYKCICVHTWVKTCVCVCVRASVYSLLPKSFPNMSRMLSWESVKATRSEVFRGSGHVKGL